MIDAIFNEFTAFLLLGYIIFKLILIAIYSPHGIPDDPPNKEHNNYDQDS